MSLALQNILRRGRRLASFPLRKAMQATQLTVGPWYRGLRPGMAWGWGAAIKNLVKPITRRPIVP